MTATDTALTWAIGANPCLEALREGRLAPGGLRLTQVPVPNIVAAFRRMCRTLEFDISEMSVVTYFTARQYGLPFTAIPVFPAVRFLHQAISYNVNSGVQSPKDFEGKKVGVRSHTLTPGVWEKGILAHDYGVDLTKVTWVVNDEEHLLQSHDDTPANVIRDIGADLGKMLAGGELAGGLSVGTESPDVRPLIADPQAAAIDSYRRTGVRPFIHTIVIRDSVLAEVPRFGEAFFEACKASKAEWRGALGAGEAHEDHQNPMPCGMTSARPVLEALMRLSVEQEILHKLLDLDELFPGNLD